MPEHTVMGTRAGTATFAGCEWTLGISSFDLAVITIWSWTGAVSRMGQTAEGGEDAL